MADRGGVDRECEALRARLRAMEDAAERIGTTLDEAATCRELVGFLFRNLCDAAAVEPVAGGDGAEPGGDREADRAGGWVAMAGPPVLLTAAGAAASRLSVPLMAGEDLYGTLLAVRAQGGFTDHETATVHFAARLAAVHLGHARRMAATEQTALNLQRALIAEPGRPHPNLEIASRYLPVGPRALVGGDWFETVRLHFGRTLLVVGDVMGHGLDAAVDMNAYRSTLRDVASTDLAPHRVLRQLDALVAEDGGRRPATCLLVRVDPARGVAMFASAGHLPPAVFTAEGTGTLPEVPVGPPLGTGVGGYEAVSRELAPGETLLLFTDGLVERRGEDIDVSLARLARLRLPPGATVPEVVDAVVSGLDARHAEDDVAVLAARPRARHPATPPDPAP
ncbi:GAF domain-containing SpoIIE family protein phosphatase [Streptomyces venezuelae]|uniref:PP2C family protein-serine/threonine phosphatase n=1 Tax=Streptomyces venezuelae TaxID=54571 RepID=UPI002958CFFE|nr:GAF domain-containing SpoIIE family protein phosphatase [Streptomyces venezuelae]